MRSIDLPTLGHQRFTFHRFDILNKLYNWETPRVDVWLQR
jgi:hypothetical protein